MGYLIAETSAITLFAGFIALTQYEKYRGARFIPTYREKIDLFAIKARFIIEHVDFLAFIYETIRQAFNKMAHDSVHLALRVTYLIERHLVRAVDYFRIRFTTRQDFSKPTKKSSEFVRTITDFKQELHKERSDGNDTNSL